ncbi:MAG TPA: helix-turn-helix transcriptional regulator [Bryobacteraceae bacterium]|nr:helix-turn-helix transcriptional regulator [Bryobacteraceae bacterium]
MDVSLVIKQRLSELGLDQRDLAAATQVTESYVSQLLTRRKAPPAPGRTDIYDKIGEFLKLPAGELSRLADLQRQEELKKRVTEPPRPLFQECRELILRKCDPDQEPEVRRIFEKEPFGELERLITQKLLDVVQGVAKQELESENWLRLMAQAAGRSYEQMRVASLEFLETEVFNISVENCVAFLDPIIDSWDMDLKTFAMDVVLNPRLSPGRRKRFEFVEQEPHQSFALEPGFEQFLNDKSLSGDATEEEIQFLKTLRFPMRRPAPLYYYRELQNLRDPLHFTHET